MVNKCLRLLRSTVLLLTASSRCHVPAEDLTLVNMLSHKRVHRESSAEHQRPAVGFFFFLPGSSPANMYGY